MQLDRARGRGEEKPSFSCKRGCTFNGRKGRKGKTWRTRLRQTSTRVSVLIKRFLASKGDWP